MDRTLPSLDGRDRAIALRARGIAQRTLGNVRESIKDLQSGLATAELTGDSELVGQLEMTLAPSVAYSGDMERAISLLLSAEEKLGPAGRVQALTQRAGLTARMGDFATSLDLFNEAEPELLANGDMRWLANLSANRGLVHAYSGSPELAEADLRRAEALYSERGEASSAAEMTHNLGFLAMQRGDISQALSYLNRAERTYREFGIPLSELRLDLASAYVLVGLVEDAEAVASEVVDELSTSDHEIARGEALVTHAYAATLAGLYDKAIHSAETAVSILEAHGRLGWKARAEYLLSLARLRSGQQVSPPDFVAVSEDLERTGQTFQSLHARLLAGTVALQADDPELAAHELELAGAPPEHAPLDIRIQASLARAVLKDSLGDRRGASAALRSGVSLLDEYRAALGSTESRINVTRHAADLFDFGLSLALESGRPSRVVEWVGRTRAGSMRAISPLPPDDADLSNALISLRRIQTALRESTLEGEPDSALFRQQSDLEQEVRQLALRRAPRQAETGRVLPLAAIQPHLGSRAMVVLVEKGDEMLGVRVRKKSVSLRSLGLTSEIEREAGHIARALRTMAYRPGSRSATSSQSALEVASERLDQMVFGPLKLADEDLLIVPTPGLASVPWAALPSAARRPFAISPSPYTWTLDGSPNSPSRCVFIAGPDLEHADNEVALLADTYEDPVVLAGKEATVENVLAALQEAELAHFACHARFRPDNALFSSLRLYDGDVNVYELERLRSTPGTVVLSACEAGLSENAAAAELAGLATAFASLGTESLVVSVAPVPDAASTIDFMGSYHDALRSGQTSPSALLAARRATSGTDPLSIVTRGAFFSMGSH